MIDVTMYFTALLYSTLLVSMKGGQLIFQGALGKQDLGRLHYRPVKDRNGSTVIVAVNHAIVSIEPLRQIAVSDS